MNSHHSQHSLRIGLVSTRFSGTDGVSLEADKWVDVLHKLGHECFYFAGESDRPPDHSFVIPEALFSHPTIDAINTIAFDEPWALNGLVETNMRLDADSRSPREPAAARPRTTTRAILGMKEHLKEQLYMFVNRFDIQLLVCENALSIPMHIPLGLALTELIAETGLPTIAHHHDFYWERKRFLVNSVGDYLRVSFPPVLPSIRHVAINSWAASEMCLRTGASAMVIPNVMDFDNPPPAADEYAQGLRADLGVESGEFLILQPTRVVQRKGIEHAIELVKRIGFDARLVISHAAGDEGDAYEQRVREFADMLGVKTRFVAKLIAPQRGQTADGRKVYALADAYSQADLVTYPSAIEGFGNAFLEAVYYRRPLVVNNYSIYAIDIKPKGFKAVEFDGFVSDQTVLQAKRVMEDRALAATRAEHNYQLGLKYFSYRVLERRLRTLIGDFFGESGDSPI